MALMFQPTTGKQHGEVSVAVDRPVTHATAKDDQRFVENLCFLQSRNEVAELCGQKGFHDLKLTDPVW